uniref:Tetraspanin n=1 Tax=Xiphophorus couchianus TaxID=32473 RepID=A0A3B5M1X1_9TELE
MAQINSCLKRTFIGFNLFFAVSWDVLRRSRTFQNLKCMENRTTGLVCLYIMGAVTMLLGLLGAYGAYKEHKISLIVFLVCMVIGSLVMIRSGIPAAIIRPEVKSLLLQPELLTGSYTDWNEDIPSSCDCPSIEDEEPFTCKLVPGMNLTAASPFHRQPCVPIVMYYVLLVADISLGVIFTLAALAVLGMILSSIMIHQLRHPNRTPVVLNVPTIFIPGPPKYHELQNELPPPY